MMIALVLVLVLVLVILNLYFLGAQGKEFIPTIQYQFPFNISVIHHLK